MKNEHRILARDVHGSIHNATALPIPFIRQVVLALKQRRRIGMGRPISPPITPRDIARIVLGLSASSLGLAADTEWKIGRLPLFAGDGQQTAEAELVDLIEQAAGWHTSKVDFRNLSILVGQTVPMLDIRGHGLDGSPIIRTFRVDDDDGSQRAQSFFLLPMMALRKIARDLLPTEGNHD